MIRLGIIGLGILFIIAILILKYGDMPEVQAEAAPVAQLPPEKVVRNNKLNGSVRQVTDYLQTSLKDPESFQAIEWGPVIEKDSAIGSGFHVRLKYRAKNGYGGYSIGDEYFHMDVSGKVINVVEVGE